MDYDFSNFVLPESLSNTGISLNAFLTNISQISTTSSLEAVQAASQALQVASTSALNSYSETISELSETLSNLNKITNSFTNSDSKEHTFSEDDHAILDDSFKKIIVVGGNTPIWRTEKGITIMGIYDFMLNENSLDI